MGSGKTTIGHRLARQLGYAFMDQDDLIEELAEKKIPEIFESEGEAGFRKQERQAIQNLIKQTNLVVATGGGAPCFFNNMQVYNENGITIYLKLPPKALAMRLKDSSTERPLIKNKSEEELINYIEQTLQEREKYYQQATFVIEGINLRVEDILQVLGLPDQ